jgi:protein-disulfide isomerase
MENHNLNEERWVEECLRALDPITDWAPDAARAHRRLLGRQRVHKNIRRASFWAVAASMAAAFTLVVLPAPARYAMTGLGCSRERVPVAPVSAPASAPPQVAISKPAVFSTAPATRKPIHYSNFKQEGSPDAPIVCEIYSDYECPACAAFYRDAFPRLESNYVQPGKLRIIHRDFPLPMHPYAIQAARLANAAGELGYYGPVFRQLFATQKDWSVSGNLDPVVAAMVPPGKMTELRQRLASHAVSDSGLAADMEMVRRDGITQTPTLVFVTGGTRTKVPGNQPYALLTQYLNEMLKR